ncbi:AroM family protein [Thermovorax subterraneus]|nr:AroM family protein [Thermovorax subterraneus]
MQDRLDMSVIFNAAIDIVTPASPYRQMEDLERAAKLLRDSDVDMVLVDCKGYTFQLKELVQKF